MAIPLVPKLLRAHLAELAENDERHDGRGRWEARDTELEIGVLPRAEGSAKVRIGNTIVYAGVKFQVMTPYPDRPNQGGPGGIERLDWIQRKFGDKSGCHGE